jgi:hypothetical protein
MTRDFSMRAAVVVMAGAVALAGCTGSVGSAGGNGSGPSGAGGSTGVMPPGNGSGNGNGMGADGSGNNVAPPPPPPAASETPGVTPLRRLTRAQYNNTIRDLLGLTGDFAGTFAGDEDAGGFRSNITSPVSEPQVEQYLRAADDLAGKAIAAGVNKVAPCAQPAQAAAAEACAADFIRNFGKRAFRRPLANDEQARYLAVYKAGADGAGANAFPEGVKLVLSALLQSPNFIYLPEVNGSRPAGASGGPLALDPYETASRLSYALWASMPDDELFAAADGGQLRTPEQVDAQARRLLGSPKARDSIVSFFQQWLEVSDILALDKDATLFKEFTPELRMAMRDEIDAFVNDVTLASKGNLGALLTASFGFPSGPLQGLYGVPAKAGPAARTELPKGQRAGLLTLAGVMAVYAHPDQSGPVGRGYMISDRLLCNTPPPAPDDVNTNLAPPNPNVTTRERLEAHRSNPTCQSCHGLMDPFGLTFENYDALGRFRAMEGNKPVDASGRGLPSGVGDVANAIELVGKLATNAEVQKCMVRQWFRYAFGREERLDDDKGTLEAAMAAFSRNNFTMTDLMVGMATSSGFRYRAPITLQ